MHTVRRARYVGSFERCALARAECASVSPLPLFLLMVVLRGLPDGRLILLRSVIQSPSVLIGLRSTRCAFSMTLFSDLRHFLLIFIFQFPNSFVTSFFIVSSTHLLIINPCHSHIASLFQISNYRSSEAMLGVPFIDRWLSETFKPKTFDDAVDRLSYVTTATLLAFFSIMVSCKQ